MPPHAPGLAPSLFRYAYGSPPTGLYVGSSIAAAQRWCLVVVAPVVLNAVVTVAPCDATTPLQSFAFNAGTGALVHSPSGLCLDAALTPTPSSTSTRSTSRTATQTVSQTATPSTSARPPGCVLQQISGTGLTPCYAGAQWPSTGPIACSQAGSVVVFPDGSTTTALAVSGTAFYWGAPEVNASLYTPPFSAFPGGTVIQFMDGCSLSSCAVKSPTPGCAFSCGVSNWAVVCPSATPSQSASPSPSPSAPPTPTPVWELPSCNTLLGNGGMPYALTASGGVSCGADACGVPGTATLLAPGSALTFTGSTAALPTGSAPSTSIAWVRCPGGGAGMFQSVFEWGGGGASSFAGVNGQRVVLAYTGSLVELAIGGPVCAAPAASPLCDGAWHHVAITLAAGGAVTVYYDGAAAAACTLTLTLPPSPGVWVGWNGASAWQGGEPWLGGGAVARVRIFDRALSAAQVAADVSACASLSPTASQTASATPTQSVSAWCSLGNVGSALVFVVPTGACAFYGGAAFAQTGATLRGAPVYSLVTSAGPRSVWIDSQVSVWNFGASVGVDGSRDGFIAGSTVYCGLPSGVNVLAGSTVVACSATQTQSATPSGTPSQAPTPSASPSWTQSQSQSPSLTPTVTLPCDSLGPPTLVYTASTYDYSTGFITNLTGVDFVVFSVAASNDANLALGSAVCMNCAHWEVRGRRPTGSLPAEPAPPPVSLADRARRLEQHAERHPGVQPAEPAPRSLRRSSTERGGHVHPLLDQLGRGVPARGPRHGGRSPDHHDRRAVRRAAELDRCDARLDGLWQRGDVGVQARAGRVGGTGVREPDPERDAELFGHAKPDAQCYADRKPLADPHAQRHAHSKCDALCERISDPDAEHDDDAQRHVDCKQYPDAVGNALSVADDFRERDAHAESICHAERLAGSDAEPVPQPDGLRDVEPGAHELGNAVPVTHAVPLSERDAVRDADDDPRRPRLL